MIAENIGKYDEKQEKRHKDNLERLDAVKSTQNKIMGAIILIGAGVPIVLHFIK